MRLAGKVADITGAAVGFGRDALAVQCDVADERPVGAAVAASVARLGGIDVLINNAGKPPGRDARHREPHVIPVLRRGLVRHRRDAARDGRVSCVRMMVTVCSC
jgi:NAD(P)-dependent dehydrogenase (short-subunit alcohol dehydrogenase family)